MGKSRLRYEMVRALGEMRPDLVVALARADLVGALLAYVVEPAALAA